MKNAIEFAGIGLHRIGFDGTVLFMNRCSFRIFDLEEKYTDPSAVKGKNISDLLIYTDNVPSGSLRKEVREHKHLHGFERYFKTITGNKKCVKHDSYLFRDPETGEESIQVIMYDITERKHAEERIKHLNLVLRAIRNVNQLITREKDRDRLVKRACEILIETRGYCNAWIAMLDDSGGFTAAEEAGLGRDFLPMLEKMKRGELTYCSKKTLMQPDVIVITDPASDCGDCPLSHKYRGRKAMTVRLEYKKRVYGILSASIPSGLTLDEEEQTLFKEVAGDIGFALYNIEREERHKLIDEESKKRNKGLEILNKVITSVSRTEDLQSLFKSIINSICKLMNFDGGGIYLLNKTSRTAEIQYSKGLPQDFIEEVRVVKIDEKPYDTIFIKGESIITDNYAGVDPERSKKWGFLSLASIPLFSKDEAIGAVNIASKKKLSFSKEEKDILQSIGRETGAAIAKMKSAEQLRLLSSAVEQSSEGIAISDLEGNLLFCNRAFSSMHGYSSEELAGKHLSIFHKSSQMPSVDEATRHIREAGEFSGEIRHVRRDGTEFLTLMNNSLLRDDSGNPTGMIGTILDITELKRVEESLRESDQKYRALFEESKDVIFISTPDGKFLDINTAGVNVFGYSSKEEMLKIDIDKDLYFDASIRKKIKRNLNQYGFLKDYEFTLKKKDGQHVTVVMTATTVRDENGKVIAYRGIMRDITEQRSLEQQLIQAQKMESIGTLAGGIAHDFNNILSAILGFASLIKIKITEDHEFYGYIDTIEKSAVRASELTAQLLAFSRRGKYNLTPVALNYIVNDTLKIILSTFDRSIEIEKYFHDNLPTINADAGQIHQVIMNLCVNARDAMPEGGRLIIETDAAVLTEEYIRKHVGSKKGRYVILSVTDTGCGIDREIQQRIFEPFFTTKETGKGTGLGLAMVYGVVKNHGGYVSVYTEKGEGTTFKVYLPVSGKPAAKGLEKVRKVKRGNELILVVDDEEAIRHLAKDIFESHGYTVLLAGNGEEAVNIYSKKKDEIGLVILDMVMPKMGGKTTFLKLKKINPGVKVLLSTGYSQNGQAKEILDSGVRGFIQKPYLVNELLSKARGVLDNNPEGKH